MRSLTTLVTRHTGTAEHVTPRALAAILADLEATFPNRPEIPDRCGLWPDGREPVDEAEREALSTTAAELTCAAEHPSTYCCERRPGHAGDHVAASARYVFARWPSSPPAPAGEPDERPVLGPWTQAGTTSMRFVAGDVPKPGVNEVVLVLERSLTWNVYDRTFYGNKLASGITADLTSAKAAADEAARRWYRLPEVSAPSAGHVGGDGAASASTQAGSAAPIVTPSASGSGEQYTDPLAQHIAKRVAAGDVEAARCQDCGTEDGLRYRMCCRAQVCDQCYGRYHTGLKTGCAAAAGRKLAERVFPEVAAPPAEVDVERLRRRALEAMERPVFNGELLSDGRAALSTLASAVTEARRERDRLRDCGVPDRDSVEACGECIACLRADRDSTQASYSTMRDADDRASILLSRERTAHAETRAKLEAAERQLSLCASGGEWSRKLEAVEDERDELRAKLDGVTVLRPSWDELERERDSARTDLTTAQARMEELEREVARCGPVVEAIMASPPRHSEECERWQKHVWRPSAFGRAAPGACGDCGQQPEKHDRCQCDAGAVVDAVRAYRSQTAGEPGKEGK